MLDDRTDKMRAMVDSTVAIARGLEARVGRHELTVEQAIEAFHADIRSIRFDQGTGYISVCDTRTGNVVMHGVNPALEGKPTPADLATGRPIWDLLMEAVRTSDLGVQATCSPSQARPSRCARSSLFAKFAPWNIVVYAGGYTDDLEASVPGVVVLDRGIGGAILLVTALIAWMISRDITRSLGG